MNSNNASWEIKDFSFQTRQVVPTFLETILTAPNGNKFGLIYRGIQSAPDEVIFESFKRNKQIFFIDVEAVTTPFKRLKKEVKLLTAG